MIRLAPLLLTAAFLVAAPATAQQYVLTETFDGGVFPPTGWSLVQNGVSVGWQDGSAAGSPGTAFHDDLAGSGGIANDNLMQSPSLDLSTQPDAWLHFENRLRWANFLANHPASSGNGASTVEISTDGGVTWAVAWTETRAEDGVELTSVDLGAWAGLPSVTVGFRYFGDFAHEWAFDRVFLGASSAPPPPPGTQWAVTLPSAFLTAPFLEDFDTAAGVVQSYMGITAVNPATGQPSAVAWCNIGQMGPMTGTSYSGSWNLEMGLQPGQTGGTYVRNALVLGVDNTAGFQGLKLSLRAKDFGEEADPIDGIWISLDGSEWYLLRNWAQAGSASTWGLIQGIDLDAAPVPVDGLFYLMFAQEDNFPYGAQDGIGVDDIEVTGAPPPNPVMSTQSTCGGSMFLQVSGCTPGGIVGIGWATAVGSSAVPAGPCAGTSLDLLAPRKLGAAPSGATGQSLWLVQVPASACGSLYVQAVDQTSCLTSPVLAL
jgi:hypothetical protein